MKTNEPRSAIFNRRQMFLASGCQRREFGASADWARGIEPSDAGERA